MEPLWITLKVCVPMIVVGTVLYLYRQRVWALLRHGSQRKFLPIPFTRSEQALAGLTVAYAAFALVIIWASEPFTKGILYLLSVLVGTISLAIFRTPFRCCYTLVFTTVIFLGLVITGAPRQREAGGWNADSFLVLGILFVFLILVPTAFAWIVTLFRDDQSLV
jgi:hypothetical protein